MARFNTQQSGAQLRLLTSAATILWLAACGVSASAASLSSPLREADFPGAFSKMHSFPEISNGYLISFTRNARAGGPVRVTLTALNGKGPQNISVPIDSAAFIESAAMSSEGNLILAGSYRRQSDRGPSNFLAALTLSGKTVFSVDLGDFLPSRVCGAPDGSIWTLGAQWPEEAGSAYSMLRRYTAGGLPNGEFLQRSTIHDDLLQLHHGAGQTAAFLSCGAGSVGAYLGTPGTSYWAEIALSPSTAAEKDVNVKTPSHSRITGLALLDPGMIYASLIHDDGARDLFQLDTGRAGSAAWTLIPSGGPNYAGVARLLGADAANLVYFTAQDTTINPVLHWGRLQ